MSQYVSSNFLETPSFSVMWDRACLVGPMRRLILRTGRLCLGQDSRLGPILVPSCWDNGFFRF